MTVIRERGFCRPKGHMNVYRGNEYEVEFLRKIRIEIKTHNEKPCEVLNTIQKSQNQAKSGTERQHERSFKCLY